MSRTHWNGSPNLANGDGYDDRRRLDQRIPIGRARRGNTAGLDQDPQLEKAAWLSEHDRLQVCEALDKLTRHVEDLDAAKDRAGIACEELSSCLAEQMNTRMYILSLIAGLFLPLGFLTSLLGANVGGILLAENPWGSAEVVVFLLVIALVQIVVFRRKNWFQEFIPMVNLVVTTCSVQY